jgi:hypothetical protein
VITLKNTLFELKEYGINIDRLILDAGYYSEENLKELYKLNIPFMTRMVPRYSVYDLLLKKYAPNIVNHDNFVEYGHRELYIIKDRIMLFDDQIPVFVYVCCDMEKRHKEYRDYMNKYNHKKTTKQKFDEDMLKFGIFILVSTVELEDRKSVV